MISRPHRIMFFDFHFSNMEIKGIMIVLPWENNRREGKHYAKIRPFNEVDVIVTDGAFHPGWKIGSGAKGQGL